MMAPPSPNTSCCPSLPHSQLLLADSTLPLLPLRPHSSTYPFSRVCTLVTKYELCQLCGQDHLLQEILQTSDKNSYK